MMVDHLPKWIYPPSAPQGCQRWDSCQSQGRAVWLVGPGVLTEGQPVGMHLGARLIPARVTHEAGESLPASLQLSQWEAAFTSLATVLVPNRQARKAMLPLAECRQSEQKWGSP